MTVGGVALTAALACGAVLASTYRWDGNLTAGAVAAGLTPVTVAGVTRARRMTRLSLTLLALGTVIAT